MITIGQIQLRVASHFGFTVAELRGRRRFRRVSGARAIALYLAREITGASYPEIGQRFGGMDHTTIMHACRRCREAMAADPVLRGMVLGLRDQVAMNLPDVVGVARAMHLTFQPGPPRVTIAGADPWSSVKPRIGPLELAACLKVASKMGVPRPLMVASGTLWVIVPEAARAAWARVHGPTWHDLSIETEPDVFINGRILLSLLPEPAPPEVVAQIGEADLVSAAALVEWSKPAAVPVGCKVCGAEHGHPCKVPEGDRADPFWDDAPMECE